MRCDVVSNSVSSTLLILMAKWGPNKGSGLLRVIFHPSKTYKKRFWFQTIIWCIYVLQVMYFFTLNLFTNKNLQDLEFRLQEFTIIGRKESTYLAFFVHFVCALWPLHIFLTKLSMNYLNFDSQWFYTLSACLWVFIYFG